MTYWHTKKNETAPKDIVDIIIIMVFYNGKLSIIE